METIFLPAYCVDRKAIEQSAGLLGKYGHKAIVIGGRQAFCAALEKVKEACVKSGVQIAAEEWYGGECTYGHMERLAAIAREKSADLVIGVGGGKALDTAKGCAAKLGVPVITMPTIAATCAAVTAISVVYDENGVFVESMFHAAPPALAVIDLGIIAGAPERYLRAGMGDALAKHVESMLASRGRILSHTCTLAVTIGQTSFDPLLQYGLEAMEDARRGEATEALRQVVLSNIVSTGLVSLLIEEIYNGAVAHALFYGLTRLPDFEHHCLHGDAVGYGVLVQQMLDGKMDSFRELRSFAGKLGMPVTLKETGFEMTDEVLEAVVPAALKALSDARVMPYEISYEQLAQALRAVESYQEEGEDK